MFLLFADFFFSKLMFSKIKSRCQTVLILIRADVLSGLIWVQTVLQRGSVDDTSRQSLDWSVKNM